MEALRSVLEANIRTRFCHRRKSVIALLMTVSNVPSTGEWKSFATTFQNIIWMQTPLFLRLFGLNVLHRHLGPQTHESFHAHFNGLFYSAQHTVFVLVSALQKYTIPTSIWEASPHEDLKNQQPSKKDHFIFSKIGQYKADVIYRIEFVISVSYKFAPHTKCYFLITCSFDATCPLSICAYHCTNDNRNYACQTRLCGRSSKLRGFRSDCKHFKNKYKGVILRKYHDSINKPSIWCNHI